MILTSELQYLEIRVSTPAPNASHHAMHTNPAPPCTLRLPSRAIPPGQAYQPREMCAQQQAGGLGVQRPELRGWDPA